MVEWGGICDGNVVTYKGLKMNSFKNVRELLLVSYVNNVVSDREFGLLCLSVQTFRQYDPFNLDDIDSAECKAEFRVEKADLPALSDSSLVFDTKLS